MKTRPASEANQEWQKLPRGDVSAAKGVAAKAIARMQAIISQELYDHCLGVLAKEALRDADKAKTMLATYRSQPRQDVELAAAKDDAVGESVDILIVVNRTRRAASVAVKVPCS